MYIYNYDYFIALLLFETLSLGYIWCLVFGDLRGLLYPYVFHAKHQILNIKYLMHTTFLDFIINESIRF